MDDFVELEYRALKTVGYSYSLIANFLPVYAHQRKAMSVIKPFTEMFLSAFFASSWIVTPCLIQFYEYSVTDLQVSSN